jgi:hypothetical protein
MMMATEHEMACDAAVAALQRSTSGLGQMSGWQIPAMTFAVAIESLRNVVTHDDGRRQRTL